MGAASAVTCDIPGCQNSNATARLYGDEPTSMGNYCDACWNSFDAKGNTCRAPACFVRIPFGGTHKPEEKVVEDGSVYHRRCFLLYVVPWDDRFLPVCHECKG